MENPIKMDDLGVPVFSEISIWNLDHLQMFLEILCWYNDISSARPDVSIVNPQGMPADKDKNQMWAKQRIKISVDPVALISKKLHLKHMSASGEITKSGYPPVKKNPCLIREVTVAKEGVWGFRIPY